MDFGRQVKQLRSDKGLTQEQLAEQLHVSRQAVSNWENNKNLPDLELLVTMAELYSLSLDEWILGGSGMNELTQKLIDDGSAGRRAKRNMIAVLTGAVLLCIGVACFALKGLSVEYIDAEGFLHENFFLLPIGALFLFCGLLTFLGMGAANLVGWVKRQRK